MSQLPQHPFIEATTILRYLDLLTDREPSLVDDPIAFLQTYLRQLPPHLLPYFSATTTPQQRTKVPLIRNRRKAYSQGNPPELLGETAHRRWPNLNVAPSSSSAGPPRPGREAGRDEKTWAERDFLGGRRQHVGKLGGLLGDYEEDREAERSREERRTRAQAEAEMFVPEEDSDSDDESDDNTNVDQGADLPESPEELQTTFERKVKERFIYGILENFDYDKVDFSEDLDAENERDEEERWFDGEDD